MTSRIPNLCGSCFHYIPDDGTCKAFPLGVPDEILRLGGDHRTPVLGDKGVVFQAKHNPRAQARLQEWEQFNNAKFA